MSRTQLIVAACFCVALAAGVAVGLAVERFTEKRPPHRGSWLQHELTLSAQQSKKMQEIWSGVMETSWRGEREKRDALQKERDQAIQALLTEKQKAQYEEVKKTYAQKMDALAADRKKQFDEAVERTKQVLTEDQRKKYDELIKQGPGWGRHRGGPGRGGPDMAPPPPDSGQVAPGVGPKGPEAEK